MFRLSNFVKLTAIVLMSLPAVLSAQSFKSLDEPFTGEITANNVYIRSGDRPEYYAVTRLSTPATVEVIGRSGAWYAIVPPKGAFSMISKRHVDVDASGRNGTVSGDNVRVRCGSLEFPSHFSVVQTHLSSGDTVKIIGQTAEYYKIVPPEGVAVYVSSAFVKKLEPVAAPEPTPAPAPVKVHPEPIKVAPAPVETLQDAQSTAKVDKPDTAVSVPAPDDKSSAIALPAPPVSPADVAAARTDAPAAAAVDSAAAGDSAAADAASAVVTDQAAAADQASAAAPEVKTPPTKEQLLLMAIEQFNQAEELLMAEYEKPQAQRDLNGMLKLYESLDSAGDEALSERILYRQRYLRLAIQRLEGIKEVNSLALKNTQNINRMTSIVATISDIGSRNVSRDMTVIGRLKASSVYKGVGAMPRRWVMYDDLTGERLMYVEAADSVVNLAGNLNWRVAVVGRPKYILDISEYVLMAHTVKKLPDGDPSKAPKPKPITTADPLDLPGPKPWKAPDTSDIKVVKPQAEPEMVLEMQNPAPVTEKPEKMQAEKAHEPEKPAAKRVDVPAKPEIVEKPAKEAVKAPEVEKPVELKAPVKVDQLEAPAEKPKPTTGLPMIPSVDSPDGKVSPDQFK